MFGLEFVQKSELFYCKKTDIINFFIKKTLTFVKDLFLKMVGAARFELATSCSQGRRTTKLHKAPNNGAPRKTRTPNLLVRSQTIYPVDLWAH